MVVLLPSRFAVLLAAAFPFVSGCVGTPNLPRVVQVQEGQRTTVRLIQFADGQTMSLQNLSSGSASDVYSPKDPTKQDPMAKVVKDAQLQALLDVLAEKGLHSSGSQSVPPDARDALLVEQKGQRWVLFRRQAGMQQDELPFHEAKAYFLSVWNGATAYHTGNVDLRGENERVRAEAQAAQRRLLEVQRKQAIQGKQQ